MAQYRSLQAALAHSGEDIDLRKTISDAGMEQEMYVSLRESAKEARAAKSKTAYSLFVSSVALVGPFAYLVIRGGDVTETIRMYYPAFAIFASLVFVIVERGYLKQECAYTAAMIERERSRGEMRGAGTIRAEMLALDKYYVPSTGAAAGICVSMFWSLVAIVQSWYL